MDVARYFRYSAEQELGSGEVHYDHYLFAGSDVLVDSGAAAKYFAKVAKSGHD
jgi:TPR repeat protein